MNWFHGNLHYKIKSPLNETNDQKYNFEVCFRGTEIIMSKGPILSFIPTLNLAYHWHFIKYNFCNSEYV